MRQIRKIAATIALMMVVLAAQAQTAMKWAGTVSDQPIVLSDGTQIRVGTQIELHQGSNFDGTYKHAFTSIGGRPVMLAPAADYEVLTVTEIRYSKPTDSLFALVDFQGRLYLFDIEKGLKSGEIKEVRGTK